MAEQSMNSDRFSLVNHADDRTRELLEKTLVESEKYEFMLEPAEYLEWVVSQQNSEKKR